MRPARTRSVRKIPLAPLMTSRAALVLILLGCLSACSSFRSGDASGFTQTGIASWYGEAEQGRRTASGERFDKYAMTAAHQTLPFGTVVRVTNLENGRIVTVRINDRGPFVRGRIIDLSARAATRLGIRENGVARVRLVALSGGQRHRGFDWVDASPSDIEFETARR